MGDPDNEKETAISGPEYYVERLHNVPGLTDDCCRFINKEWKRSHSARLRSIEGSSENFPMSLILLKNSKKPEIVGHCKISKLFMSHTKVFVETVVIHPSLRGKGLGKFLMNEAEEVCKSKNIKQIYLATKGQEGFYEKLGYIKCPPVNMFGCHFNDSNEDLTKTESKTKLAIKTSPDNKTINSPVPPPAPPMPNNNFNSSNSNYEFHSKHSTPRFNVALASKNGAKRNEVNNANKMRDYTTNNYCNFLWVNDLIQLKKDSKNAYTSEVLRGEKSSKITIGNVTLFGTIVEVKQVGCNDFLYQIDDGTGVIACKHSERQFEEVISVIESEQVDILNQLSGSQKSFEQSSILDYSGDDSIFNDRSVQMEEISIIKKCKLKGLLSIWDDIYNSFHCLFEPYNIGDFVLIQGRLYTYFNINQIYINKIRAVDLMEEIMLMSIKLENSFDHSNKSETSKVQLNSEKRLSGLITFDNIPHLNPQISIPKNIEIPDTLNNSTPEIVTPNLTTTITFDTFTKMS